MLVVLVDALRWDYLERARFMGGLARRGVRGRFQEPFGFTPRHAYFRGRDVEEGGFTHMFEWSPGTSPFAAARHLAAAGALGADVDQDVRAALVEHGRARVTPFARRYLTTAAIPLAYLPYFDLSETEADWEAPCHPDGLFGRLATAGIRHVVQAWPDTNGRSDRSVIASALDQIDRARRFAFVHLSALDAAGHAHGPGAPETQRVLDDTDRLVEALVDHCRTTWGDTRVVIFGDHGMVPVVRSVDAMQVVESAGLRFGQDFGYFVDSTCVRFWYFTRHAQARIREALSQVSGAQFLDDAAHVRWGVDRCRRSNGDDFFVADPGVVFAPSFFGRTAPRAMHGYDPTFLDNQGAFVRWDSSDESASRDAGVVEANRLFATMLHACGLAIPACAPSPVTAETAEPMAPRYTNGTPAHEALVAEDLTAATALLRRAVPDCDAIVLAGSFGRGEGVVADVPGPWAVNDYDLVVLGGRPTEPMTASRDEVSRTCRAEGVDVSHVDGQLAIGPSQFGYDIRAGARVLYGAPTVLTDWGATAPGALTTADAWYGVSNRVCGVVNSWRFADVEPAGVDGQLAKLGVALGDAWLIGWGDYHHLLAVRQLRVAALGAAAGLVPAVAAFIDASYRRKLGEQELSAGCAAARVRVARCGLRTLAGAMEPRRTDDSSVFDDVAARAVEGWARQRVRPRSDLGRSRQVEDRPQAAALADLYRRAWRLFDELPDTGDRQAWCAERDVVVSHWLQVVHG